MKKGTKEYKKEKISNPSQCATQTHEVGGTQSQTHTDTHTQAHTRTYTDSSRCGCKHTRGWCWEEASRCPGVGEVTEGTRPPQPTTATTMAAAEATVATPTIYKQRHTCTRVDSDNVVLSAAQQVFPP